KIKPALLNHTFERKSIKITKSARYLGFMEGLQWSYRSLFRKSIKNYCKH
ncbi:hypothetical protein AAKU64_003733, partial [Undibacterium sp. GrIS 1.8]